MSVPPMTSGQRLLIDLADQVTSAERQLREGPLYWAASKVADVTKSLEQGRSMNSLGELQTTGPGFDVAVVRLETAAHAFKLAWHYLGDAEDGDPIMDEWLLKQIEKSPRLTAITKEVAK